jgi:hypothetical protein
MLEFSPDTEMSRVSGLANELFEHVLYDEEPLFVSDEATLWDVSMAGVEEVWCGAANTMGCRCHWRRHSSFPYGSSSSC